MTFKTGDRVKYVGNSDGEYNRRFVNDTATVTEDTRGGITYVHWDSGEKGSAWTKNFELIAHAPSASESVMEKYVAEFEKMVAAGTVVPRYTALGFLSEFIREYEASKS